MKIVWELKRGAARDIYTVAGERYGWAVGTVKTFLRRLVDKGYLRTTQVGNAYLYEPRRSAISSLRRAADELMSHAIDGTVAPLLAHMIRRSRLRPEDAAELQSLLDSLSPAQEPASEEGEQSDTPPR
jgi:predicted transcriptional regulator